jgi:hypothetical protein
MNMQVKAHALTSALHESRASFTLQPPYSRRKSSRYPLVRLQSRFGSCDEEKNTIYCALTENIRGTLYKPEDNVRNTKICLQIQVYPAYASSDNWGSKWKKSGLNV